MKDSSKRLMKFKYEIIPPSESHTTFNSLYSSHSQNYFCFVSLPFLFPVACAPVNVSASLVCPNSAHVTWVESSGATSYNVTAVGQDGHIEDCSTNGTSCQIRNMQCGQNYTITVTPYAGSCAGNPSIPHHFIAGKERKKRNI